MKKQKKNRIFRLFKLIYIKIFRINDSPQKIAIGLGLGVFLGIMPGTGPLASLFLALLLRVNRAAALLGSILTNTWLSVIMFLLSVKVGSAIMKLNWQDVRNSWLVFLKDFHWANILKVSMIKVILPVILGYLIIALSLGLLVYFIALTIIFVRKRYENKSGINLSR
jgi:hypothetical protein